MSKISLAPDASGTGIFTIASPNSNTNRTLTLPDDTGTIVTNSGNQAGSFTTLNTSGAVVFNDAGADVDFRVESDTVENALFVEGSSGNVGIGTGSPASDTANERILQVNAPTTFSTLSLSTSRVNTNGDNIGKLSFDVLNNTATYRSRAQITSESSGSTANKLGATLQFFTASDNVNQAAERMRIDSSGNVGIGTASPTMTASNRVTVDVNGTTSSLIAQSSGGTTRGYSYADSTSMVYGSKTAIPLIFQTTETERMRITSGGVVLVGATTDNADSPGIGFGSGGNAGLGYFCRNAGALLVLNRNTDDGTLVLFRQAGVDEGNISVSGNTVSYNPFLGSHSGALADWSKPEIKIGTVMDTIDELLDYKVVVIDVQEEVPAKEAVMDEEGNEVEPAQEATTQTVQKRISYNGNGAVGSSATVEYEGQEYTGTIQHEREKPLSFNKHLKVKVNDTAASKAVFGVFVGWNNDSNNDGGVYNDMLVGAVGNYVIRMAAGQEPQIGDLVEANGNGCAVVQDDDIIRTKTIAKVTSTIKQVTYDDGSFLVTCVLYCG